MAKYSTGGIGGDSSGSCELCGAEGVPLETTTVAGATLEVCGECTQHGEKGTHTSDEQGDRDRRRKAARNAARLNDARSVQTDWESGADYEDDPLPYLVRGYGERTEKARQDAGLQIEELAAEIDVDVDEIIAVEQGRAARANVGGSVIEALEAQLEIELAER